jgi:ketosteroid isomerase-like protein
LTGGFDEITDEHVGQSEEAYRMFREGDLRFFDRLDPDIDWWIPETIPHGGSRHGEGEVIAFWEAMAELFEEAGPHPEEFIPAGDRLIILGTWRARVKATGDPVEARFAHVNGYRDGKLVSFRNYIDSAKIVQALEAGPGN